MFPPPRKWSVFHVGAIGLAAAFVLASSAVALASAALQNSTDASVVAADIAVLEHCVWNQNDAGNNLQACADNDPWQNPYRVEWMDGKLTVTSAGPDGQFGTQDDTTGAPN